MQYNYHNICVKSGPTNELLMAASTALTYATKCVTVALMDGLVYALQC